MSKTTITIDIPVDQVWRIIKEKYNIDDSATCTAIIETNYIGTARDGYHEHTLKSLQIKYTK